LARTALLVATCALAVACARAPLTTSAPATAPATTASATAQPRTLRYDLHVGSGGVLAVKACGVAPAAIGPVDGRARAFARDVGATDDGCLRYTIDLAAAAAAMRSREAALDAGDGVLLASPDVWLWTTTPYPRATLHLTVDDGVAVSLPFPRAEPGVHVVDETTWRFLSCAIIGPSESYERRALDVGGARIDVAVLPGPRQLRGVEIDRFVGAAATAVALGAGSAGRFPVGHALVVVQPVWGGGVPFGMVVRGGGAQVLLLVGEHASLDEVIDAWVPVHELAHLLHPYLGSDDAWFGEGYASYQQQVLRARAGLLGDVDAWDGLRDGLERGARAAGQMPLGTASARMRDEARWLQVYWGGAAIALWLDVTLRRCGQGGLDDVVAKVRLAAQTGGQPRVDASEIIDAAAASAGSCADVKGEVAQMLAQPFPSAGLATLAALGVGHGALDDTAPLAAVRRRITARQDVTW